MKRGLWLVSLQPKKEHKYKSGTKRVNIGKGVKQKCDHKLFRRSAAG